MLLSVDEDNLRACLFMKNLSAKKNLYSNKNVTIPSYLVLLLKIDPLSSNFFLLV